MSWFPVDDAFHSHPKGRRAGLEALGLWTVSGSYCMAYLTDGFVPEWFVKEKPKGTALAKRLVDAGLWSIGENAGEKGWWFHQWKHECTKDVVLAAREKSRQRKAKSRESHQESRRDTHRDERRESRDMSGPTQPNPTQPINPLETLGGGVTSVDARETPRPQCPDHETNSPGPCPACLRRRKWDEAHEAAQADDELDERRRVKDLRDNCPACKGTNWIPNTDPAVKCDHAAAVIHA